MKRIIKPVIDRIGRNLFRRFMKQGAFRAGHYYSPIPDASDVAAYLKSRKPPEMELPDVGLNRENQYSLLQEYRTFYAELPFPEKKTPGCRYFYDNSWFSYSDAIFLYCFLRKHRPARIIEIGSGFSSAVMLDTTERFFPDRPAITFIEPYPDRLKGLLAGQDERNMTILDKKVQDVPSELFSTLESGDLLFIDSSHVVKCGSDLQMLLFDILPHLPSGVFVHFHDVFYPFDYPAEWLEYGRYWNENYFLRAFLAYNSEWSVYFFNSYVALAFPDFLSENMPLCLRNAGGSLYVQRVKQVE
ncbi:MAG: class I SAM-dependent methyltransferase [Nitrospirae bacterium]|nr:class I SAM-dependent methyltransferase [Nitrospirota bacterium]